MNVFQKYRDALYDLTLLRDHYKAELKKKLEEKVAKQRINMKRQKHSKPVDKKPVVSNRHRPYNSQ